VHCTPAKIPHFQWCSGFRREADGAGLEPRSQVALNSVLADSWFGTAERASPRPRGGFKQSQQVTAGRQQRGPDALCPGAKPVDQGPLNPGAKPVV
jgi:hypothetical protein